MSEDDGYIRGARAAQPSVGRIVDILLVGAAVALCALAATLAVSGVAQNTRIERLRGDGVPVTVAVVGCQGLASGTGITASGFRCRGSFTYAGRTYTDMLGGTTALYQPGQLIGGITVRDRPYILATATSVGRSRASWHVFVVPAVLFCAAVGCGGVVVMVRRRRSFGK
jgi:hypothetical protein